MASILCGPQGVNQVWGLFPQLCVCVCVCVHNGGVTLLPSTSEVTLMGLGDGDDGLWWEHKSTITSGTLKKYELYLLSTSVYTIKETQK